MIDSFVTQCPNCRTSFRVNRAQLSAANGAVRCGACLHVYNAAQQLLSDAVSAVRPQPRQAAPVKPQPSVQPVQPAQPAKPAPAPAAPAKAPTPTPTPTPTPGCPAVGANDKIVEDNWGSFSTLEGAIGGANFYSIKVDASKINGMPYPDGADYYGAITSVRASLKNTNLRRISISRCPGEFPAISTGCATDLAQEPVLRWTTETSNIPLARRYSCKLEKTGTYYINVTHTNLSGVANASCTPGNPCYFRNNNTATRK